MSFRIHCQILQNEESSDVVRMGKHINLRISDYVVLNRDNEVLTHEAFTRPALIDDLLLYGLRDFVCGPAE